MPGQIRPKSLNPSNKHKTIDEHIVHVIERIKKRFDLDIDRSGYEKLLELSKSDGAHNLYDINASTCVKNIGNFMGKPMWVVYGRSAGSGRELPSRVKTVLYPDMKYSVPDKIRHLVSREDFTTDVNSRRDTLLIFSKEVVPSVTLKELFTEPRFEYLSRAFRTVASKLHYKKADMNSVYKVSFDEAIESYKVTLKFSKDRTAD
jgi:hypothetical protein